MILLGAGSSVPLGIPTMKGFTEQFLELVQDDRDSLDMVELVKNATEMSGKLIGVQLPFDLESLMTVLTDLASIREEKPISILTAALLIEEKLDITSLRQKYSRISKATLTKLRDCVFETCMKPIVAASEKGSFHSLDIFYGPLITLLNGRSLFADEGSIGPDISDVFSTNWDLCFKNWVYYNNFGISDGTQLDNQRMSYFSVDRREYEERGRGGRPASRFYYMALHGSLDLTRAQRPIAGGTASYITKLGNPLDYYRSGPDSRENIFMIYPLEAIGYDESIRSPYLDMLYLFKWSLEQTSKLYVVGYSFRDPTVGSIIEEAIGLRMSKSDIKPLPEDFETRKSMARENRFNVIVLTPEAENVRKSLIAQNRMRLAETFVPVEVNFPKVDDSDFKTKYEDELKRIYSNMQRMGIRQGDERHLATAISTRYGLSIT